MPRTAMKTQNTDITTTNEHLIKFKGKASIPQALELGHAYRVQIDGEITQITESNNQDSTKNKQYVFEPLIATITTEHGETIKTKDTRSKSKQLRKIIYSIWMSNNNSMDSEKYYEKVMDDIMNNIEKFT